MLYGYDSEIREWTPEEERWAAERRVTVCEDKLRGWGEWTPAVAEALRKYELGNEEVSGDHLLLFARARFAAFNKGPRLHTPP